MEEVEQSIQEKKELDDESSVEEQIDSKSISEEKSEQPKKRKKWFRRCSNLIFILLILILIGQIVLRTCYFSSIVSQNSMEPTLYNNDIGLTDGFFFKMFGIKRFDIVIIDRGYEEYYVKRVIGLPGESITYQLDENNGKLYINGKYIKENFIDEETKRKTCISTQDFCLQEYKLANDEYFVMGDNRGNSQDSRFPDIGPIKKSTIIGRGFMKYGTCVSPDCKKIKYGFY